MGSRAAGAYGSPPRAWGGRAGRVEPGDDVRITPTHGRGEDKGVHGDKVWPYGSPHGRGEDGDEAAEEHE
ncbi:hypothetical protein FrEUN1fDRAFT_4644 [Parafrankia sp. EUN1f]|nr:hypothetical protein FrEUN1fDRAFT_4644 [Parafrankia sp. EUN1f]